MLFCYSSLYYPEIVGEKIFVLLRTLSLAMYSYWLKAMANSAEHRRLKFQKTHAKHLGFSNHKNQIHVWKNSTSLGTFFLIDFQKEDNQRPRYV